MALMGGSARLAAVLRCCTASQLDTELWSCIGVVLMTPGEREDVRMDVRALMFGDGDIVSGWGSLKVDSDGEWLDCIHYVPWSPLCVARGRNSRFDCSAVTLARISVTVTTSARRSQVCGATMRSRFDR